MPNSNSKHSRKLRIDTSAEWNKQNIYKINVCLNKEKDKKYIDTFEKLEKNLRIKSKVDKIRFLIDFYISQVELVEVDVANENSEI